MVGLIIDRASDVRIQEINLSQVITSNSTAVGCQVVVSNQGSPFPKFWTDGQPYLAEYGNPNAAISFDVYCGLDFFKEGNQLWSVRAVHEDALYSGAVLYNDGLATLIKPVTQGVKDPENPDWPNFVIGSEIPVALFYPTRGQGSYADRIQVETVSNNIEAPTGAATTSASTGGALLPGTYEYQVSALNANGETLASQVVQLVIGGSTVTNVGIVSWNPEPLATGYYVYGRSTGSIGRLALIGQGTYQFRDTGVIDPDMENLPIGDPALAAKRNPQFTVNVYDTEISTTRPQESFLCTLTPGIDGDGNATELEERINPFSEYIQVANNTPTLLQVPIITTSAPANLGGGDSGSAPTAFDVAAAYDVFKNKQLYKINTLINGGHSTPVVQLAMDSLAQRRQDCVAMLDVPSAQQKTQQAINYRNLQLNLNSTYSALFCPDVLEVDTINGKQQYVPFSGWAAALCARTDRVANPAFSIAGLNRGLVSVLRTRYTYDDGESTELFKAQVNYTRTFIGQGIALWEQKTLAAQTSALSWLSVRRIVNVMKTSLYQFLLYSLQEPNDEFTGRQIVGACTDYLELIKNARGISSYTVISDTSNNSAAQLNSGIRNVTVIIVPLIPIHEIQLSMVISKQGVTFTETLSQINGQQ